MQVNFNPNQSHKQNPQFTAIRLHGGAEGTLKKVLKPHEWLEFEKIIQHQNENQLVDLILWGRKDSKKLDARLLTDIENKNYFLGNVRDYSQRFFEGTMSFIKRMSKNADEYAKEIEAIEHINPDEILKGVIKQ